MSTTAPARPAVRTTAQWLADRARTSPSAVALSEMRSGVWHDWTWQAYHDTVVTVANAWAALGVGRGDRVAIHAENRPEWLVADLAAVAAGGVAVGIYPTSPAAEVRYLLADSGTRLLVAEDQEQVDKALEVADDVATLEHIVYMEPRGITAYSDPRLRSWEEVLDLGRRRLAHHGDVVADRAAVAAPEDVVTLIYTSGTTGPPKGAQLTAANVDYSIRMVAEREAFTIPGPSPDDVILSYLPLCHIAERIASMHMNLGGGAVVHFAESIDTVQRDLIDVQPSIFFAVPRIWEKIKAGVETKAMSASWAKRTTFRLGMRLADRIGAERAANGGRDTLRSRVLDAVGWPLLFRPLRDRIGLSRCRYALSGAAPIAPELLRWLLGIGVPVHEVYGMTESTGMATANRPGRTLVGTVGEPLPGVELQLEPTTGEILLRHPGVFAGYWGMPDRTREAVDPEGWLHTGDVGEWLDGRIRIIDRIKDIIITAGGKNISPSEIENALRFSPFIREAIVIGDGRRYLTALLGVELDTVSDWAQRRGLSFTTYRDLSEKPEVLELLQREVQQVNGRLAQVESIKQFRVLVRELDHEDGDLTATQKVKRSSIASAFHDLIEDMYSGSRDHAGGDLSDVFTGRLAQASQRSVGA